MRFCANQTALQKVVDCRAINIQKLLPNWLKLCLNLQRDSSGKKPVGLCICHPTSAIRHLWIAASYDCISLSCVFGSRIFLEGGRINSSIPQVFDNRPNLALFKTCKPLPNSAMKEFL